MKEFNDEKVLEKLTRHDEQLKTVFHRLSNIEEDREVLNKMEVLMEINTGLQKELVSSVKEMSTKQTRFEETFLKVNENLTVINSNHKEMQSKISNIETDVNSTAYKLKKVEELANKNTDKGKFDVVEFISKDLIKYVLLALAGVALYYMGITK